MGLMVFAWTIVLCLVNTLFDKYEIKSHIQQQDFWVNNYLKSTTYKL